MPPETAVSRAFFRWYNNGFTNHELSARQVATAVSQGHGYAAQHDGYRHQKNFTAAQHIDLDFDTCDHRSTIDYLLDDFIRFPGGAAFIYTTASHTDQAPKARVFFELSEPIADPAYYRELRAALLLAYDWADQVNKDPARISYGAAGCNLYWLGHVLDLEMAHNRFVVPYREYQAAQQKAAIVARPLAAAGELSQTDDRLLAAFLRGKLDYLLNQVETAPDGQKYYTLQRVAFTLGGYVASGHYSGFAVANELYNAIARNPHNVKSLAAAETCINDALLAGQAQPLYVDPSDLVANDDQTVVAAAQIDDTWQTAVAGNAYDRWMAEKRAAVGVG